MGTDLRTRAWARALTERRYTRGEMLALAGAGLLVAGCGTVGQSNVDDGGNNGPFRVAMVPKFTSDPFFVAVEKGAKEAADGLEAELTFNGPVNADVAEQADIIDQLVQQKYDAITVAANDPDALAPSMNRAQEAGVAVSTFNADVKPEARRIFFNQTTFEAMGRTMVDMMVDEAGPSGEFLIVTAVLTAPNQNRWIEEMKKYAGQEYPDMRFAATLPSNEDLAQARRVTLDYLQSHPETAGVYCVTGIATPGVAEAVKQLDLKGEVAITGLGVPSLIRPHVKDGTVKQAALWDPVDLGYGAVHMVKAQLDGKLGSEGDTLEAGRLGKLDYVADDEILLGEPLIFSKDNIDEYDF